jgi:sigma-B regulation protein RsbU (phosphoserine phosphatase)
MMQSPITNHQSQASEPAALDPQALLEANKRLDRAVAELSILNELAVAVGASKNSDDVMAKIVSRSLRAVDAEQGMITLLGEESTDTGKTLVRGNVSSCKGMPIHMNTNLLGWMLHYRKPLILNDPDDDDRFRGVRWDAGIQSVLCVPLMVKSELTGILTVFNKRHGGAFDDEDQRLLSIIASQSAQVIENARLHEQEKAFLRMQEEVRIASRIQSELFPHSPPMVNGYDIAGKSVPAQMVGGDYFDFIPIGSDCWGFCVGDVSGKGLPASLLMANTQAALRGQALVDSSPSRIIARSNTLLYRSTESGKFVTLFLGILDPNNHQIHYANGGHNCPILFSGDRSPTTLAAHGMMLGFMEDFDFGENTVGLAAGDLLVVYSDGITEATNAEGEQFGEQRLIDAVQDYRDASSADLLEKLMRTVCDFAAGCPQSDDMTLVVVKRL